VSLIQVAAATLEERALGFGLDVSATTVRSSECAIMTMARTSAPCFAPGADLSTNALSIFRTVQS
jgi:hypothetical protein